MKTSLIFHIHNPNPSALTIEHLLPLLIKANADKLDTAITDNIKNT